MQNVINGLVEKWDWWIYHQAYHSLKRMCVRNRGFAYLIQLQLNDWIKENPMEQSLVEATEQFYNAMVQHNQNAAQHRLHLTAAGGESVGDGNNSGGK